MTNDVMIEMAKDSDKLESENFIEKVNNIPWPKPFCLLYTSDAADD